METLLLAGAGVAAAGVVFKQLVLPVYRWAKRFEAGWTYIEGQMRNNGGQSLRDAVDRIDTRTARLEDAVFPNGDQS